MLRTGIAQFNSGDYWECHETLEELWRGEPDPVRYLYQGILLAGVGLLHLRRGNRRGALSKLRAAVGKLEPYVPVCMGVDVASLRADLLRLISHLDELDAAAPVALRISMQATGDRRQTDGNAP
jgi:predicted metal-dependent hydrolase